MRGRFLERPNRFLVRCRLTGKDRSVSAFLPNPGRLWELLLPDAPLYLARRGGNRVGGNTRRPTPRRTAYTVLAVEREGRPILLHTGLANSLARFLLERDMLPTLEGARVVRGEVTLGTSRFDLLLRHGRREVVLEVKSCTLFGNGVAMFPDAVTERGRRHLLELAGLSTRKRAAAVLFLVHSPTVHYFMPDYHTDPAFAQTLVEVRERVRVIPVALEWLPDLTLGRVVRLLEVPWGHIRREAADRGSYILLLKLTRPRRLEVGKLGRVYFPAGYYLYLGSGGNNLSRRIARHLRRRKRMRWHIDFLRAAAEEVIPLPIRSSRRLECAIARAVGELFEAGPTGFGSSDCACPTHLFRSPHNPLSLPAFHHLLQRFRMQPPKGENR